MKTFTRGGCVSKAWKPPSSRLVWKYFEFRSKRTFTHYYHFHGPLPHKLFASKYCFLIPGDDTSFFFFISFSFSFLLFYVIINFYKNYFIIIIIIILFIYFHENYFYFVTFRDVPECSGLFHVPDFIDTHEKMPQNHQKILKSGT